MDMISKDKIKEIFTGYNAIGEDGYHHFAILVPVVETEQGLELLYEVRARKLDRQPGEICFPGGLIEEGETPEQSALRETWEEVGIRPEEIEVVTKLDSIYSTAGSQLHCFLGLVSEDGFRNLKPSPAEVAEVFTVPLQKLLEMEPKVYTNKLEQVIDDDFPYDMVTGGKMYPWRTGMAPVPVYEEIDGHIIWGLTGRITKQVVAVIRRSEAAKAAEEV